MRFSFLLVVGLCVIDGKNFRPGIKKTNLREGSHLKSGRHKTNWRLKRCRGLACFDKDDLFFTGALRIDRNLYTKISHLLKQAIENVQASVDTSGD